MRRRGFGALLLLGLVGVPDLAPAQEVNCAEAMAQSDLNACAYAGWEAADAELNRVYKAARARLQELDAELPEAERGAEAALRAAQKAWVSFRDAACSAEGYLMHGGSAEPLLVYGCMERLTTQRSEDLRYLAETE